MRTVREFRRKYKTDNPDSRKLQEIIESQGYTFVEYNGICDSEEVNSLIDLLGVRLNVLSSKCFTYRDDKYRILFIHEDLNEDERRIVLAHEEGHIWNGHMDCGSSRCDNIVCEFEANEFAHYLLHDTHKKAKLAGVISGAVALVTIVIGISAYTGWKNAPVIKNVSDGNLSIGDHFEFGTFEQDNNKDNGTEPIEWIVLNKDDTSITAITKYALTSETYNVSEDSPVTWQTCSLRSWLNEDFYDESFTQAEKELILVTDLVNDDNPDYGISGGDVTQDKVWLLDIDDVYRYFTTDESRRCAASSYARAHEAIVHDTYTLDGDLSTWWWLRNPGCDDTSAASVDRYGIVNVDGLTVDKSGDCVRPVIRISLQSD